MGSVGAIVSSLEKLSNDKVRVKIVHTGVGTVNESDIMLAGTSDVDNNRIQCKTESRQ